MAANRRPVVIITSNAEKELPDAFLRRCVFHYIAFPDPGQMEQIVRVHHPDVEERLLEAAMEGFYLLRELDGLVRVIPPHLGEYQVQLSLLEIVCKEVRSLLEHFDKTGVV